MAKNHYTSSKGFFDAASGGHFGYARILYPNNTISEAKSGALFLAFYNVLGFSVELYLKAFLSMHVYSIDDLSSKPFGHDLQNLLERSIELGFSVQEDGLRNIV